MKFSAEGDQAWNAEFVPDNVRVDDVTISPDGDVTGIADIGPTVIISRWSEDGAAVWRREYENLDSNGYSDWAGGIASDEDGDVLAVGGRAQAQANVNHDVFLRRYSAAGNVFWTRVFADISLDEYAHAADVSLSGGYYVACGARGDGSGERVPWVGAISYDNSQLWNHFDTEAAFYSEYLDVAVAPDGSIVVAGLEPTAEAAILLARLTPDGDEEWSRTIDNFDGIDERGLGVAASSDGTVLVSGVASGGWLGKFSADGETLLWTMTRADADDGFADVEVDSADNVFVCGARPPEGGSPLLDVWVARLTP